YVALAELVRRLDDLDVDAQRHALSLGSRADRRLIADEHTGSDAPRGADGGGLQRARFRSLGQHDAFARRPRPLDETVEERRWREPRFAFRQNALDQAVDLEVLRDTL